MIHQLFLWLFFLSKDIIRGVSNDFCILSLVCKSCHCFYIVSGAGCQTVVGNEEHCSLLILTFYIFLLQFCPIERNCVFKLFFYANGFICHWSLNSSVTGQIFSSFNASLVSTVFVSLRETVVWKCWSPSRESFVYRNKISIFDTLKSSLIDR